MTDDLHNYPLPERGELTAAINIIREWIGRGATTSVSTDGGVSPADVELLIEQLCAGEVVYLTHMGDELTWRYDHPADYAGGYVTLVPIGARLPITCAQTMQVAQ